MAIPISINSQQLGFRLLELPPEVLELLESDDAPVLQLKSSDSSDHTVSQGNAVLCTPNRSFEVRQVQSSNVLYILQQSDQSGFTAIAQCKGMLELVPSKSVASDYVLQRLPTYEPEMTGQRIVSRADVQADAPFSDEEIANALRDVCAFEKNGGLWLPEAKTLLKIWSSLLTAVTIEGIKLDRPWNVEQLATQVYADNVDENMYRALLLRLNRPTGIDSEAVFDAVDSTAWVGETLLAAQDGSLSQHEFMSQWQDLLPETWRSVASLNLLQNKYHLLDDQSIESKSTPVSAASTSKTTLPPKSKWHQKFRK